LTAHDFRFRQAEECSRLIEYVANGVEPAVGGNQVEKIAVLARGSVGLMCS
jgi:hypothetical protein